MRLWFASITAFALSAVAGAQFFDDFNRADSTNMGANWTEQLGDFQVLNNRVQTFGVGQTAWMQCTAFSGSALTTTVGLDLFKTTSSISYVAVMIGVASPSQSVFVKVQDNLADGTFNRAYFYYGNANDGGINLGFSDLTPFTSGRMFVSMLDTDTVQLQLDTNFDSVIDQTYVKAGASAFTLGTGVAMGIWGTDVADNFRATAVPEPGCLVAVGAGLAACLRRRGPRFHRSQKAIRRC